MKRLMNRIKSDIEKQNITNKEIAKALGVSEALISNYFNLRNRISFVKFLDLINFVYGEEPEHIIKEFCLKTEKLENDREALEWCSLNSKGELVEIMINKVKNQDNKTQRTFALLYELLVDRYKCSLSPEEFLIRLEEIKMSGNVRQEAGVFINILSMYGHFDFKSSQVIKFYAKLAMTGLEKIANTFIKESYKIRINEMLAISSMKQQELEKSKQLCQLIITQQNEMRYPVIVNSIYCLLSELYVFSDYDKSLFYINKALLMTEKVNMKLYKRRRKDLEATHDFIKITNNDFSSLYLTDKAEQAHYFAKRGTVESRKTALRLLDELEHENGRLSLFQQYYKALALQDMELMRRTYEDFLRQGETYYAQLPFNELPD